MRGVHGSSPTAALRRSEPPVSEMLDAIEEQRQGEEEEEAEAEEEEPEERGLENDDSRGVTE